MSFSPTSETCGPFQLPQQTWYRVRSGGIPRSAWFSAAMRGSVQRAVIRYRSGRHDHVVGAGKERVVDLQYQAGIDDCPVFLVQRIRDSEQVLFVVL